MCCLQMINVVFINLFIDNVVDVPVSLNLLPEKWLMLFKEEQQYYEQFFDSFQIEN